MASNPPVVKKQSWLSKLGQDILKVLGFASKVEQAAEPIIETAFPVSIPAFAIFDKIMQIVMMGEATFAAVGLQSNGPAKLAAALPQVSAMLDQWVASNLPGGADIVKGEAYLAARTANATAYVNAAVAFLNSLPPSAQTVIIPGAVSAGAAAQAVISSLARLEI